MQSPQEEINPYLQQEVLSASPLRLRWMLIQRAEELCGLVRQLWQDGQQAQGDGWVLRIREILGELLNGIQDKTNPVSRPVSDFYVFLLQFLGGIERSRDIRRLQTLQELLNIESETWAQVVRKSLNESESNSAFNALSPDHPAAPGRIPLLPPMPLNSTDFSSDFSLEV